MNQSIANSQDATAAQQQPCSEKKCITCFENRGCMYEQYVITVLHNIEESYPAKQKNQDVNESTLKQEDKSISKYSSQNGLAA